MRINKKAAAVAVAAVTLAGTGVAYAYWSTTGSGSGTGTAAASNGDLKDQLTAVVPDGIYPGGNVTVTYKATNSSKTDLFVGTITPTVSVDKPGCDTTWFHISPLDVNKSVPAGTLATAPMTLGTTSLSLDNAYTTDSTPVAINQDACKGAKVTVSVTSN